jgi:hypothetical protein
VGVGCLFSAAKVSSLLLGVLTFLPLLTVQFVVKHLTAACFSKFLGFSVRRGGGNVLLAVHLGQEGPPRDYMDCRALGAEAAKESGRGHGHWRLRRLVVVLPAVSTISI